MNLKQIFQGIQYKRIQGETENICINKICYDSRKVEAGDIFFCIEGYQTDGHKYAQKAYENGAAVILCQKEVQVPSNCVVLQTEDTRKALALAAANFYDQPSKKMKIIGVTGTNGKTTSTFMIKSILEKAGYKVGVIGTIANFIGEKRIPTERTTPESLELQELFYQMSEEKVQYCIMEVSSHSLSLDRVYGITFSEGIFTNLTQDHLDFHKTFENYFNAKKILFLNSECSIINIDDEYGQRMFSEISTKKVTFGIGNSSDIMAENIQLHSRGVTFQLEVEGKKVEVELPIPGRYNVYNALGCAVACLNEGIDPKYICEGLKDVVVPGRCEIASKQYNLGFEIILDYAHSPDSLQNILTTAKEFTNGRLISVFGCGGDRDRTKRPIMGRIGTENSDIAIITSDNPRSEEPLEIIKDILAGVEINNYEVIENRKEAIKRAIQIAEKGDVIVIAGKGHEDYQVLKEGKIHFDEREVIAEIIKELF